LGTPLVITMTLPRLLGITAGQTHTVMLSTRGNDFSATTREGFHLHRAGRRYLLVETGGNRPYEYTNKVFDIYPTEWRDFWVWSINMFNHDTAIDAELGMNIYKVFFTPPGDVPASNSLN
jgi:hypothetical protein